MINLVLPCSLLLYILSLPLYLSISLSLPHLSLSPPLSGQVWNHAGEEKDDDDGVR